MTIGVLIAVQLVFDVLLVLLLVAVARQRHAPATPPAWHDEFLQLAREVMAVADALLEAPEREPEVAAAENGDPQPRARRATPMVEPVTAAPGGRNPRDQAFALLRAGAAAEEVARRTGLLPGELRLIAGLVASERALRARQSLPPGDGGRSVQTTEPRTATTRNPSVPSGTALA
jgi:hypothetical protein